MLFRSQCHLVVEAAGGMSGYPKIALAAIGLARDADCPSLNIAALMAAIGAFGNGTHAGTGHELVEKTPAEGIVQAHGVGPQKMRFRQFEGSEVRRLFYRCGGDASMTD